MLLILSVIESQRISDQHGRAFFSLKLCVAWGGPVFRGKILPVSVVYLARASLSRNVIFRFRLLAGIDSSDIIKTF